VTRANGTGRGLNNTASIATFKAIRRLIVVGRQPKRQRTTTSP